MEMETEQERAERVEREKERGRAKRASIFAGLDAATEGDAPLLANTLRNRERVASGRTRASLYFLMDDTRSSLSSAYTRFTSQRNPSSLSADPRLLGVTFLFAPPFCPFRRFRRERKTYRAHGLLSYGRRQSRDERDLLDIGHGLSKQPTSSS